MSLVKLLIVLEGCAISSWCTLFFLFIVFFFVDFVAISATRVVTL